MGDEFISKLGIDHEEFMNCVRRAARKKSVRIACHMLTRKRYGDGPAYSLDAKHGILDHLAGGQLSTDDIVTVAFFLSISAHCRCLECVAP